MSATVANGTPDVRGNALPPLVLVGAQSRAGRAIAGRWPNGSATKVHRGAGPGATVDDYFSPPDGLIQPGSVVVNCVGTPNGAPDALMRLNHDVPLAWARAAARAGARQFIQLSSFSVYGRIEEIGVGAAETPDTPYGQSKLAADRALLALDAPGLIVTLLRIPMLFGGDDGKLAQLVRLVRKTRVVPRLSPPIARSMLGYDGLAAAIVALARYPVGGVLNIADPTLFTYELLRTRFEQVAGRRIFPLPVPGIASRAVGRIAPSVHARLLRSSKLAAAADYPFDLPADAGLVAEIDRLVGEDQR